MKPSVIDISHWQTVDPGFEGARDAGIVGVIHKLTEGTGYIDPTVEARAFLADRAELAFGVYHFIRPGSISRQAQFFVETAASFDLDAGGDLLYALDHEDPAVSLDEALEFLEIVTELTGRAPVIYSGHVIKEQLAEKTDKRIYAYRLWLAQYCEAPPSLPAGFERYWLWQYTDQGKLPGLEPAVDLDYYDGDPATLRAEWSGLFMPEETLPDLSKEEYVTTITLVSDTPIGVHVRTRKAPLV